MEDVIDLTVPAKKGVRDGTAAGLVMMCAALAAGAATGILSIGGLAREAISLAVCLTEAFGMLAVPLSAVLVAAAGTALFLLHEASHYMVWRICLPKSQRRGLRITMQGFQPCTVCPEGRCSIPLMLTVQLMPLLTAGFGTTAAAYALSSPLLILAGAAGISLAGQDVLAARRLLRYRNLKDAYCMDSVDRLGCVIYQEKKKEQA